MNDRRMTPPKNNNDSCSSYSPARLIACKSCDKNAAKANQNSRTRGRNWSIITLSARNMVKRSMPTPQPAVGGRPYSIAVQKSSSCTCGTSKHHATNREAKIQRTTWRMVDEAPCESPLNDLIYSRAKTVGIFKQQYQSHCTRIPHFSRNTTLTWTIPNNTRLCFVVASHGSLRLVKEALSLHHRVVQLRVGITKLPGEAGRKP